MNKMNRRHWAMCGMAAMIALMTGCNTVEGLGKDVKAGGELIEEGAQKTHDAITD